MKYFIYLPINRLEILLLTIETCFCNRYLAVASLLISVVFTIKMKPFEFKGAKETNEKVEFILIGAGLLFV